MMEVWGLSLVAVGLCVFCSCKTGLFDCALVHNMGIIVWLFYREMLFSVGL